MGDSGKSGLWVLYLIVAIVLVAGIVSWITEF